MVKRCATCRRPLGVPSDVLSRDCGGDCWGCIGWVEAELGDPQAFEAIAGEISAGLRSGDGSPKPAERPEPARRYRIIALIALLAILGCIAWLIYDLSLSTDL